MISFIIPSHNYGKYLEKCVDSIFKNKLKFIDSVTIINDSSNDNTNQIINNLLIKYKKINYHEVNFRSLTKTMNYGIKKTKSEYISKIDADDWIGEDFAYNYFNNLLKKKYDYIYGNVIVYDEVKDLYFKKKQKVHKFLNKLYYPLGSGTIFKKSIWEKIGGYNENLYYQDDYDFWLKINRIKNIKIGYIDQNLYYYRKHNKSMSKNFLSKNYTKYKLLFNNIFK